MCWLQSGGRGAGGGARYQPIGSDDGDRHRTRYYLLLFVLFKRISTRKLFLK